MTTHLKHKTKVSKGIYIVMAISMIGLSSVPVFFKMLFGKKKVVATVNGLDISGEEYRYAVNREERVLSAYKEKLGADYQKILAMFGRSERAEETALEQLLIEKLLLGVAQKIPIHLSPTFVKIELSHPRTLYGVLGEIIPQSLITENGFLRVDVLKKFLQMQGLTLQYFEYMVENLLAEQLVMQLVQGSALVSEAELQWEINKRFSTREFSVERVPLRSFESSVEKKEIGEQELVAFYDAQNRLASRYWSAERRSGMVWTFDLSRFAGSKDQENNAEQSFLMQAEQVIAPGKSKELARFIEEHGGKQGSLKKIQRVKGDFVSDALFSIDMVDGLAASAGKGRGHIGKLSETIAREQIPLDIIRDEVSRDLRQQWIEEKAKESMRSSERAQMPGYTVKTVKLNPAVSQEVPEVMGDCGFSVHSLQSLVVVGKSVERVHKDAICRVTLVGVESVQKELLEQQGGIQRLKASLWEKSAGVLGRNFVASLRDHAILSVHTLDHHAS